MCQFSQFDDLLALKFFLFVGGLRVVGALLGDLLPFVTDIILKKLFQAHVYELYRVLKFREASNKLVNIIAFAFIFKHGVKIGEALEGLLVGISKHAGKQISSEGFVINPFVVKCF